jgi:hypothetical protein
MDGKECKMISGFHPMSEQLPGFRYNNPEAGCIGIAPGCGALYPGWKVDTLYQYITYYG